MDAASDDRKAVRRVRAGDANAFADLVQRHGSAAQRLARQWVGPNHAPDVAQEALVRAYRYLESYDTRRPFRPWLLRIVANVARAHLTKAANRAAVEAPASAEDHLERLSDTGPTPEAAVVEQESLREVRAAVSALPPEERAVLYLVGGAGHTYREAAQILGWRMSLVKNRLARARRRLVAELESQRDAARQAGRGAPPEGGPGHVPAGVRRRSRQPQQGGMA